MAPCAQTFNIRMSHLVDDGILQCLDIKGGRGLCDITIEITDKPVFNSDLNGMVFSFIIDKKRPEGAFHHIVSVSTGESGLVQKLTFLNPGSPDNGNQILFFFGKKVNIASYVI